MTDDSWWKYLYALLQKHQPVVKIVRIPGDNDSGMTFPNEFAKNVSQIHKQAENDYD